jgi:hypothetical protein
LASHLESGVKEAEAILLVNDSLVMEPLSELGIHHRDTDVRREDHSHDRCETHGDVELEMSLAHQDLEETPTKLPDDNLQATGGQHTEREGEGQTCSGMIVRTTDFQTGGGRAAGWSPVATKSSVKTSPMMRS